MFRKVKMFPELRVQNTMYMQCTYLFVYKIVKSNMQENTAQMKNCNQKWIYYKCCLIYHN